MEQYAVDSSRSLTMPAGSSASSAADISEKSWEESNSSIATITTLTSPTKSMMVGRLPPERRGELRKARSLLVEMEIPSLLASPGGNGDRDCDDDKNNNNNIKGGVASPSNAAALASPTSRRGTLTFANSIKELKRAGSSRDTGPVSPKPIRRKAPTRTQSCFAG